LPCERIWERSCALIDRIGLLNIAKQKIMLFVKVDFISENFEKRCKKEKEYPEGKFLRNSSKLP